MTPQAHVRRFSARTSRDAFILVRQAFGDDAVVLSTRPSAEGVEVMAMAGDALPPPTSATVGASVDGAASILPPLRHPVLPSARGKDPEPLAVTTVEQDVAELSMSTLSFQDYVRERMLRRRQAEKQDHEQKQAASAAASARAAELAARPAAPAGAALRERAAAGISKVAGAIAGAMTGAGGGSAGADAYDGAATIALADRVEPGSATTADLQAPVPALLRHPSSMPAAMPATPALNATTLFHDAPLERSHEARADVAEMMGELRAMRGLIEDRFGALAFMEKLQRQPRQAQLTQQLLEQGFSPALIRKLSDSLPADGDAMAWAAGVLERNLLAAAAAEAPLEDSGGVFALIGATGVGKTTSAAKLAAAFATRHGAAQLGLITLDAYRVAAHEQLRAYGRILGVPVHTAHDRASLEDLLELLAGKKMVLIDTAGMAQRDTRTAELLEMLSHRNVQRLLVVNAAAQGETIEDVLTAYRAGSCRGVILSKLDEAVKLGPALDAMIRHKLKVLAVANGQRVPEDWHRLSANALVHQALRATAPSAWRMDAGDMNLVFAGMRATPVARQPAALHG